TITSGYGTVDALNANFNAIEAAFDNTLSRDGDTPNQMSANLDMNGFSILNQANPYVVDGLNWRGNWVTATSYKTGDIAQTNGIAYICIVAHTSGVFATDLAAVRWQVFVQTNLPTQTGNSGRYLSTDGSLASWQPIAVLDGSITTAKLTDNVLSADVAGRAKMADGFVSLVKLDSTARQLDTTRIDVASAATVTLTTSAPNTRHINITGTTTITQFTVAVGVSYFVRFNASLTLTNNANIVTQTGANITTQAGDTCILRATAANVVEVLSYVPAKNASQIGTAPTFGARAWVNFDGTGTVSIRASGNVSSITDQGTGNYTVNLTTAMPDTNYSICYGFDTDLDNVNQFAVGATPRTMYSQQSLKTTSNFRIFCGSNASVGSTALDFRGIDISVFR
ncbi:MAG: carbohydrate-binding protein, partial [Bacteroidota bacterium]